jgi:hypothetical protein
MDAVEVADGDDRPHEPVGRVAIADDDEGVIEMGFGHGREIDRVRLMTASASTIR